MTDFLTPHQRSERMRRIRGRGNATTELRMVQLLRHHQIWGWRRHQNLIGTPDFVFRRERLVIFLDGCFWHGCPECYRCPASNVEFWDKKRSVNQARDRRVNRLLRKERWVVVRIWEHELSDPRKVVRRVRAALTRAARREQLRG